MALSPPQPGQVIRYAYLWWNARVGREDATKDRPCGMILTRAANSGNTIAYVRHSVTRMEQKFSVPPNNASG
jgi:hypothetical protein